MIHTQMTCDLESSLRKPDAELEGLFRDGERAVPPKEARRQLARAYGQGFDILPVCDNPDQRGYCNCDPRAEPCHCGRKYHSRDASFCPSCGSSVRREVAKVAKACAVCEEPEDQCACEHPDRDSYTGPDCH
jgi:hypothetical protein